MPSHVKNKPSTSGKMPGVRVWRIIVYAIVILKLVFISKVVAMDYIKCLE